MSDGYTPRLQGAYLTPTVAAEQVSGGFGSPTIMGVEGLFCLLTIQQQLAVSLVPWCSVAGTINGRRRAPRADIPIGPNTPPLTAQVHVKHSAREGRTNMVRLLCCSLSCDAARVSGSTSFNGAIGSPIPTYVAEREITRRPLVGVCGEESH